jgi:diguanylate cyclase (GGDEF)-like protein/PAS domain S-box-containing protein
MVEGAVVELGLTKHRMSLPDRVAVVALGGVVMSVGVWVVLAWIHSVMHDAAFIQDLLAPESGEASARLAAIVVVLFSTLVVQMLYTRRLRAEDRYRQLVEESPDMVLVHRQGHIVFLNSRGAELMGCPSIQVAMGRPVEGLWEPNGSGVANQDLGEAILAGKLPHALPIRLRRMDGTLVDVELSAVPLSYEGASAVQCVARDISERVRSQRTIHRLAYYDPLTDLPNRTLFRDRLGAALARAKRRSETLCVAFVDLDDFKAINDTLGHAIGDGVLKEVGQRLRGVVREEDTVARRSGDEFTIIAVLERRKDADALAKRIVSALGETLDVEGHRIRVTASIGIATYPQDGNHEVELLSNADAAMYRAKQWGPNSYRLYDSDAEESVADRRELQAGLGTALRRDELEVHYQPQVDLRDGQIVGVEALLRWNHPDYGLLRPADFLDLAEQAGDMEGIGRWVLGEACKRAGEWRARGLEFQRVAVNLSAREFVNLAIVDNVTQALGESGLPAHMLELEITETVAMYNVEQVLAILNLLREIGVRVAVDDFGTGYSSMGYLKRFPIQTLKIAQEFMKDVHIDLQSAAIVSTLIRLCRELGLDVVAEGVEHPGQLDFLRDCGCYVIQGYVFSEPLPARQLEELLAQGICVNA